MNGTQWAPVFPADASALARARLDYAVGDELDLAALRVERPDHDDRRARSAGLDPGDAVDEPHRAGRIDCNLLADRSEVGDTGVDPEPEPARRTGAEAIAMLTAVYREARS